MPSVTEQLVYEMGDPHSYITPDVVADFTTIQLEQAGENRVRVFGIKGRPATDKLKVSIAYRAGFKAVGTLVYSWPDALDESAARRPRAARAARPTSGSGSITILTEFVGVSATHGPLAGEPARSRRKCSCASACAANDKAAVERFTREIAPLVLNGPPSVTGFAGGRPKVEEIVAYWPALIDKTRRADERSRCSHEGPPARHRARALRRQGRHGQRRRDRARAGVVSDARART